MNTHLEVTPATAPAAPATTQATEATPERPIPTSTPRIDIYEGEHDVLLLADLPGVTADAVKLDYDRGKLVLTATTSDSHPLGPVRWSRAFLLGRTVQADGIRAELKDGVLRVTLPKVAALRKRTVEVAQG